ncbi:MAG: isoprenylcysteine carboxylmethyltransferase family protein [Acidobacteriia bacterium]|nr:isoprenylcysteine carboxylmethyltransferase family protein [Terriglobia bacterium]
MRGSKVLAYSLLTLAYILGCGSLGLFGLFLWAGPHPLANLNLATPLALAFDALLAIAFFVQHSGMIRKSFRAKLGAALPDHYHMPVYAIASGAVLFLMLGLWQPSAPLVLRLGGPLRWLARGVFLATMAGMAWGFSSLKHFDPLGAGPLLAHLRGVPARTIPLTIRGPYRWVRHPIYALFLLMIWASPDVTADRLLFNVLWSVWMVVGTRLEERDLTAEFGDGYKEYQRRVPMLVPRTLRPRV